MLRRLAVHLVALAVFAVSLVGIAQSGTLAAQTALGAEPIGWVLESSGIVHELGGAPDLGDAPTVASPAVALTATIDGNGFWVLLSNGEISAHGTAIHHGDLSDIALDRPAIALSATPSGNGYIVLAQDGGVFSFGDAGFFGSVPAVAPDAAINTTAVAIQISEYGYRIIHDDGGVFAFGDAHFAGSIPGVLQGRPLDRPITAAVEGPSQRAYAMMGGDGGVFAFGMTFQGSMAGIAGIEIVAASNDRSDGYVLLDRSGTVSWLTGTDPIQQTVPVSTDAVAVAVVGIPISVWPDTDSNYSIEQAISDRAQDTTIAYDALAFFTGNTCSDSFLPPGKIADFFGFQYLRDVTQEGMGHSTDFVTNSANNVLFILDDTQKQMMIDLASSQVDSVNEYALDRYPLLVAFRRQLEGDLPAGTAGLNREAIIDYSRELYSLDAEIAIQRAELFGRVLRSLDSDQIAFLDDMVEGGFSSWTPRDDQVDKQSMSHDEHVLVMTYASEMFGWYAGTIEADTYFAPERHATYFGSFYMKDAPAMGNPGYVIDETITGTKGDAVLAMLDAPQAERITDITDLQRVNLYGIVSVRRAISTELRKFIAQSSIDTDLVMSLALQYGAYDGENVYHYATQFAKVMGTLTDTQTDDLMLLRDLDEYPCSDGSIYLYSDKTTQPSIQNTDFLFE